MNRFSFFMSAGLMLFCACSDTRSEKTAADNIAAPQDILLLNLDTSVNPADDFFSYANGTWLKNNPIPDDQTSWGIGQLVNEELYKRKRIINEEAIKNDKATGNDLLISNFWKAAMDTVKIEQQGITAVQTQLKMIDSITTKEGVQQVAAFLHRQGIAVFFSQGVGQDAKSSEVMAYYLNQGGLGLPNRDYYFLSDAQTSAIRAAYPQFISTLLQLSGIHSDTAIRSADKIMALEISLARASRQLEDLRDPYANYNKMTWSQLSQLLPQTDLNRMLKTIGVHSVGSIIVGQPEFFKELNKTIQQTDINTLKAYMRFHLLAEMAPYLGKKFNDARFNFYGKTMRGALQQKEYWKRVLDAEESAIGEVLGQLFAKEYFNESAKKRYSEMVEGVRQAYKRRIEKLTWMSDSTKVKAIHKLASIKKKVGYPDKWKDFSTMNINSESFAGNMLAAKEWWNNYELNKLGKPVNRDEWEMTPQTYNAYYNPSNNEIVLPAGIFTVPGYRDEQLDDALVWGYAGASTIGHEITHGFDDEGRQFDAEGNLKNWWSQQDEQQFKKRAQLLVHQFDKMVVTDGKTINGKATLGENLADLGGILIGLDAFMETETYKKGETINGLTPLQRYFMGYALGWLYQTRPAELARRLITDVHSPAKQRVNGPMPNVPHFYDAFGVKKGNKMYLADSLRVHLW